MKSRSFLRKSRGIHLAETKAPTGFCKNRLSGNPEEQKTAKTANSADRIDRNRRKPQIPWTESSEIGENCKFRGQNRQKSAKTANSADRIIRNR